MHRLTYSLLAVVLLAIIGIGWGLDKLAEQIQYKVPDSQTLVRDIGGRLALALNASVNPREVVSSGALPLSYDVVLVDSSDFPLPPELKQSFNLEIPLVLESQSGVSFHFKLPAHDLVLSITPLQPDAEDASGQFKLIFTLIFYAGVLLLLLAWLYPLISRLHQLRVTAQKLGEGDLEQRISTTRFSYIGDIETEFNRMALKIQNLVDDNKLLSSAVSHDLRTPLARLRFGIDALSEVQDEEKRKVYEKRINRDLNEMESLVATLLSYARLEQSLQSLAKKSFALDELVAEICESFDGQAKKITFHRSEQTCNITAEKRYLRMLISNVLQNAVRYAAQQILVSVVCHSGRVVFCVQDDGPGIDEDKRSSVVKPFVKGNSFDKSGYGMGLAIVARVAEWHGAAFLISSSKELGGASITVEFSG